MIELMSLEQNFGLFIETSHYRPQCGTEQRHAMGLFHSGVLQNELVMCTSDRLDLVNSVAQQWGSHEEAL